MDAEIAAAEARLNALLIHRAERRSSAPTPQRPGLSLYRWQVDALEAWSDRGHRGVVEAVTGAGKTRVGIAAIAEARKQGQRAVVIVPSLVLVKQWATTLNELLPDLTVSTSLQDTRHWDVMVTTVQSAMRRPALRLGERGLLVADECHRYGAEKFAIALRAAYDWRLGLSATLERGDAGDAALEAYFAGVCFHVGYERALAEELISPYRFAFVSVPLTTAERSRYTQLDEDLKKTRSALVLKYGVPEQPIAEFLAAVARLAEDRGVDGSGLARLYLARFAARKQLLAGTRMKRLALAGISPAVQSSNGTIVFTQTQQASHTAAETLEATGCSAVAIHSDLDGQEREERLELFRTQQTIAISAPRILDEGVDVPEADLGVVMASNRSRRQMIQRLGRVLRRRDGKVARFVVMYAADSVEDPFAGDHLPDFYDECIPWAEASETFDLAEDDLPRLLTFLGVTKADAGADVQRQIAEAAAPPPSATVGVSPVAPDLGRQPDSTPPDDVARVEKLCRRSSARARQPDHREYSAFPRVTGDIVYDYLGAIGRFPLLTATEEPELARAIEAGLYAEHLLAAEGGPPAPRTAASCPRGRRAFRRMVCSNLRLVVSIANITPVAGSTSLTSFKRNLGLIRAVQKFDFREVRKAPPMPPGGSSKRSRAV
ncbi:MAG: DEAD/DEAH box helicase family protein [Propionibacteriaceae bacterium]|nr:DEAD/DEAH box helicase family protein [Propionibacteriaceae bacterium]